MSIDWDAYTGVKRPRRIAVDNSDVFGYRFDQPTKKGEDAWLPGITQPLFENGETDSIDVARHERGAAPGYSASITW